MQVLREWICSARSQKCVIFLGISNISPTWPYQQNSLVLIHHGSGRAKLTVKSILSQPPTSNIHLRFLRNDCNELRRDFYLSQFLVPNVTPGSLWPMITRSKRQFQKPQCNDFCLEHGMPHLLVCQHHFAFFCNEWIFQCRRCERTKGSAAFHPMNLQSA